MAAEVWIERRIAIMIRVAVATGRIGLANLDQDIGHWSTVIVQDTTRDGDLLAKWPIASTTLR
jgi:hypothetical protein